MDLKLSEDAELMKPIIQGKMENGEVWNSVNGLNPENMLEDSESIIQLPSSLSSEGLLSPGHDHGKMNAFKSAERSESSSSQDAGRTDIL